MASGADNPESEGGNGAGTKGRGIAWKGGFLDIATWQLVDRARDAGDLPAKPRARDVMERARGAAGPAGLRHLVVGVIGPRDASPQQIGLARRLGRSLGALSVTTICGGRSGVMEAVCEGVADVGGLSIGILPGYGPESANPFVGIPLPTGLSEGRNMVIARAARVLIAVGGSYGTLTEMAYGLHFGKTVIALDDAPQIDGVTRVTGADAAIEACCEALLRQAEVAPPASAE